MPENTDEDIRELLRSQKLKTEVRELEHAKKKLENSPNASKCTAIVLRDDWYDRYEDDWHNKTEKQFQQRKAQLKELLEMKIDYVRQVEEIKAHYRNRRQINPQNSMFDSPVLNSPCPLGHNPSYCISRPCDNREQCRKDQRLNPVDFNRFQ